MPLSVLAHRLLYPVADRKFPAPQRKWWGTSRKTILPVHSGETPKGDSLPPSLSQVFRLLGASAGRPAEPEPCLFDAVCLERRADCDGAKADARIKQDIAIALQESRKMLWF